MSAELNSNTVSWIIHLLTCTLMFSCMCVRVCMCVCMYDSGNVTGSGERQSGWGDGQYPGRRRRGASVFAPSGRDLWRLRQSPDAQQ